MWHWIRFYYSAQSHKGLQKPFEQKHEKKVLSRVKENFITWEISAVPEFSQIFFNRKKYLDNWHVDD